MVAGITTAALGLIIIVIGIVNMCGNISSLHSYHRNRVAPEDVKPMGRIVGLGTLLVGLGMVAFGGLFIAFDLTSLVRFAVIGIVIMVIFMAVGLVLNFYGIIKYNKGLFG